jgi:serine/threonine-protein kinase RsbW
MPFKSTEKECNVEKRFELTVDAKLENLPGIGQFIDETMRRCGVQSAKDIYAVQLSVDEACTNIVEHAYSESKGEIVITCVRTGEKFVVTITDHGEPFDPTAMPEPDIESGLNERKEGGLGIYFMRKFMDEVTYIRDDGKNLLIIAKHIKN